jgi:hypothetical protein
MFERSELVHCAYWQIECRGDRQARADATEVETEWEVVVDRDQRSLDLTVTPKHDFNRDEFAHVHAFRSDPIDAKRLRCQVALNVAGDKGRNEGKAHVKQRGRVDENGDETEKQRCDTKGSASDATHCSIPPGTAR